MTAVRKLTSLGLCVAGAVALLSAGPAQAQQATMSFFVSSVGGGKGADFGGLAGADKHCQTRQRWEPDPKPGTLISPPKATAR
jgi:hypothetical protein